MNKEVTPLPCPFCGAEAHVKEFSPFQAIVGCNTNSCRGNIEFSPAWVLDDFALAAWNKRNLRDQAICSLLDTTIEHLEQIANGQRTQVGIEATLLMVKSSFRNWKETGSLYSS